MICARNIEEVGILQEFRKRVTDLLEVEVDETTCVRFLLAREFDQEKSEEMLRNYLEWRNAMNCDYLLNIWQVPLDMKEDFKYSFTGKCHNGGPVVWVQAGEWNFRHFVEQGRRDDIIKFCIKSLERVLFEVDKAGDKQSVAIYGFEGLTYHKVSHYESSRVFYECCQILEQNYPEILQNIVVVNAPYPFYVGWNIISPLLSKRTTSKINVFGSDKKKYVPVLRKLCPDESIPLKYL